VAHLSVSSSEQPYYGPTIALVHHAVDRLFVLVSLAFYPDDS
jgi:hypothetical protein